MMWSSVRVIIIIISKIWLLNRCAFTWRTSRPSYSLIWFEMQEPWAFCEMTSWPPSWKYDVTAEIRLRQSNLMGVTHAQETCTRNLYRIKRCSHPYKFLVPETFRHSRPIKRHNFGHVHLCKFPVGQVSFTSFFSVCHPYWAFFYKNKNNKNNKMSSNMD